MMFKTFFSVLTVGCLLALPHAHAQSPLSQKEADALITPFYTALNAGNDSAALVAKVTSDTWTSCSGNDTCKPREQVIPMIAGFGKLIPDLTWQVKDVLISGNRIIVRGEASGTPAGDFMGTPHSGKSFKIMSIDIHTVENGKISRSYHVEDWLGATRQLAHK